MAVSWTGAGLPAAPLQDGFSYTPADTLLETEMDSGAVKRRRRFSTGVQRFNVSYLLSASEYSAFLTFFYTTTKSGSIDITWPDPFGGANRTVFIKKGSITVLSAGPDMKVSMVMEQNP